MSIYERVKAEKVQERMLLAASQSQNADVAARLRAALKAQLMAMADEVRSFFEPEIEAISADGHSISSEVLYDAGGGRAIVKVLLSMKNAGRNSGFIALPPTRHLFEIYVFQSDELAYMAEQMDSKGVYYTSIPMTRVHIKKGELKTQVLAAFEAFLLKAEIFD